MMTGRAPETVGRVDGKAPVGTYGLLGVPATLTMMGGWRVEMRGEGGWRVRREEAWEDDGLRGDGGVEGSSAAGLGAPIAVT